MFRKIAGASLLTIWLVLSGIAVSDDIGLIQYYPEMDRSVEAVLASWGEAVQIPDDAPTTILHTLSARTTALYPSGIQSVSTMQVWKETKSKDDQIYKLHCAFLI